MNMFSLEGKTAWVTGASGGIGFAIAEALGRAGARIVFNCRSESHSAFSVPLTSNWFILLGVGGTLALQLVVVGFGLEWGRCIRRDALG